MKDPGIKKITKGKNNTHLINPNIMNQIDTRDKDREKEKDRDKETKTEDSEIDAPDPDPEIKGTFPVIIEKDQTINTEYSREKKTPLKNGKDKRMRNYSLIIENSDLTVLQEVIQVNNPKTHKR